MLREFGKFVHKSFGAKLFFASEDLGETIGVEEEPGTGRKRGFFAGVAHARQQAEWCACGLELTGCAVGQDKESLIAESADLLYHLLVLWAACGVTPEEAYRALDARTNRSGIEEKKSRG